MLLGDRKDVSNRLPMPVTDMTVSAQAVNVTAESVSFTDGAAGTTQKLKLVYDKVMSEYGDRIGAYGDTSLSFTTGTVLTTEVAWKGKMVAGEDNDTHRLTTLSNGEYMVDYENGYILGKSATVTSSSTDAVSYKVRKHDIIDVAIETGDIEIGAVEIKNGSSDQRATVNSSGQLTVLDGNSAAALVELEAINDNTDALETGIDNLANPDAPSITRDTSVDEVAAVAIKSVGGNMYGYYFDNPNGYDVFVKWYNTAAASVTVGTTAVVRTTRVPAVGAVFVEAVKPQQNFTTAISIACTRLIADNDTTALATDIYAEVYYK